MHQNVRFNFPLNLEDDGKIILKLGVVEGQIKVKMPFFL